MLGDPQDTRAPADSSRHSIAAENVQRTLVATLLRCMPSDTMLQRDASLTSAACRHRNSNSSAAGAGSRTFSDGLHAWPAAMSVQEAQRQLHGICTAALDVVGFHLRNVLWMSSHHVGDIRALCATVVAPDATSGVLEELCDVSDSDLDPLATPPQPEPTHAAQTRRRGSNSGGSTPRGSGGGVRMGGPPHAAPASNPASVHVIVGGVQAAAAGLYDAQQFVKRWKVQHEEASTSLLTHLDSATNVGGYGGAVVGNSVGSHGTSERVRVVATGALAASRKWVAAALAHGDTLLERYCSGILSIEASRAGRAWAPGAAASSCMHAVTTFPYPLLVTSR